MSSVVEYTVETGVVAKRVTVKAKFCKVEDAIKFVKEMDLDVANLDLELKKDVLSHVTEAEKTPSKSQSTVTEGSLYYYDSLDTTQELQLQDVTCPDLSDTTFRNLNDAIHED